RSRAPPAPQHTLLAPFFRTPTNAPKHFRMCTCGPLARTCRDPIVEKEIQSAAGAPIPRQKQPTPRSEDRGVGLGIELGAVARSAERQAHSKNVGRASEHVCRWQTRAVR